MPIRCASALARCELVVVSDCRGGHRHARVRARAAAGRGVGRERRHGDEFRATHLAPARVPAAARRSEAGLVDHGRSRASAWDSAPASTSTRAREIFDEHARLSAAQQRRHARLRYRRARAARRAQQYRRARRRCSGRCAHRSWSTRARRYRHGALFGDGRFFHADGGRASSPRRRARRVHAISEEFPLVLNTGRIRDQWHTMTRTGRVAAARRSHARTLRRHARAGRAACRRARGRAGARDDAVGLDGRAPAHERRHRARHACSCRSTGARRTRPTRASARWSIRSSIPCPASRSSSTRRRASSRSASTGMASS